jgi:tRNA-dihydrouridine synthase A
MDGVMIGRAAYENPYLFSQVDNLYFNTLDDPLTRGEVLLGLIPYLENQIKVGTKPHHVLRHILGLFHGIEGARKFRKLLTESMHSVNFESSILTEFTKEQKGVC